MKKIMAIVNLTPDSFYSESRCDAQEGFLSRVRMHLDAGADMIDVGACSTRPGHELVSVEEEMTRLKPALELWQKHFSQHWLSLDTFRAEVVEWATQYVPRLIVNDVTAGDYDEKMLPLVGQLGCPYVAMHHTLLEERDDVVGALCRWYEHFSQQAEQWGVRDWTFDPGFGFGKTLSQNWALLRRLSELPQERPILVGVSRKSMLYRLLPQYEEFQDNLDALIGSEDTWLLTRFAHRLAASGGASIFRVHSAEKVF